MKCHKRNAIAVIILWPVLLAALFVSGAAFAASPERASGSLLHFSLQPDENEISSARVFDEPLLPLGGKPSAAESRALADAMASYVDRTNLDDFSSLEGFLGRYPQSAWSGSLRLHLGVEYYNFGYYSKALDSWEQSWNLCEHVTDPKGKLQADRALGELARMYSKLGRTAELQTLLDNTKDRPLSGPATQLIHQANQGLWLMKNRPQTSYRCGPLALDSILAHNNPSHAANPLIMESKSSTNGYSLAQLPRLSWDVGLNYQAIFRNPYAPVPVPSVIHWKVGHYAAVLQRDGDKYLIEDHTFLNRLWMTETALNSEASGYFLVPPGPLPSGWRPVPEQEAQGVWGKGQVGGQVAGALTSWDIKTGGNSCKCPMTTYTMHTMLVSLTLNDTPVGYAPPVGPAVDFTATYNQLEANQPATFYYSNLGQKWTCNWVAYITDNPQSPNADGVSLYVDGGGTLNFSGYNATTGAYNTELMSQTVLVKTSSASYEWQFPDGSKKEFTMSDGSVGTTRRIFLTQVIDPAGNLLTLNYDPALRITNIVDAIGQTTTLLYTNANFTNAITSVTDPFGRTASLLYNTNGILSQITDILGLTSQYAYGANDFVQALTTPYGTTTFTNGGSGTSGNTWLQATDPLGETEFLEFNDNTPISENDPPSIVPAGMAINTDHYLQYRNSIYWDKKAYADGAGDITKARIYHFLHQGSSDIESPVIESEKEPLENRVWNTYLGQAGSIYTGQSSLPSFVGRVLDDGTTQLYGYQYNALGNITNTTDPVGRNFSFIYATNGVDLLQAVMTRNGKHEVQVTLTYNSQHLPLTFCGPDGQYTTNTYNSRGQLLSTTDPLGEMTSFSYATNGYLMAITGPLQATNDITSFSYDSFGRIHTITNVDGYTLTFAYDSANRKTKVTHPDGTFEQFVYSNLDLVASCDRLGRWTTNTYNANRQLATTRDPLGRVITYDWCKCGALTGLTDPMGRTTTWDYDIQSRPTAKHYVDGSSISYTYENTTSRPKNRRDEKGQYTFYEYYPDNSLKRVSYPNAIVSTPTVMYTYDSEYNRVLFMQDEIGVTTLVYNPITSTPALGAGMLASVSGPLPNSIVAYQYDALARATNRAVDGVAQAVSYDILGRPITVSNALGTFRYSYLDATPRLASEAYPNGQTNLYFYYGNLGDKRLHQIRHLYPNGSLLSGFGYAYNSVGQITALTNQWDTIPDRVWTAQYDAVDQLTNVSCIGGSFSTTNYTYVFDTDGNRLRSSSNNVAVQSTCDARNKTVATISESTKLQAYTWDGENRLATICFQHNSTQFFYDGLGRLTKVVEITNGVPFCTNYFVWCGTQICQQLDGSGERVIRLLYPQGETVQNTNAEKCYFYSRDHLNSVREASSASGTLIARYDYDPFGRATVIGTNLQTLYMYAGYFYHSPSGLYLTLYRPLDPSAGHWMNPDPIAEAGGVNVYKFVGNNPLNEHDTFGLDYIYLNQEFNLTTFGFGHAGSLIGNDQTGYYYFVKNGPGDEKNHNNTKAYFKTWSDFLQSPLANTYRYNRAVRVKTDCCADNAMIAFGNQHYDEPYDLTIQNCGDLALEIMMVGGIDTSWNKPTGITAPNGIYDALIKNHVGLEFNISDMDYYLW